MADYRVRCECGKDTVVSEWALGAPLKCKSCGRPLEPTEANTRPAESTRVQTPRGPEAELPLSPEARIARRVERPASPYQAPASRPATPAPRPAAPTAAALPTEPAEPSAPPPPPPATECARCGRAFRGDWDRYRRGDKVLCHICANLIHAEAAPEEEGAPTPPAALPPLVPEYKGVLDRPNLPEENDHGASDYAARQERIRRWVLVAAVVTLVAALAVIMGDDTPLPTPDEAPVAEAAKPLPPAVAITAAAIIFVFRFVNLGLALYVILRWKDRLPSDYLIVNIVWLLGVAIGLQGLGIILLMVPFIGFFVWLGLCAYILWDMYDLEFTDLLMLAVFLFLLQPVTMVLRQFVLGIIGLVYA